MRKYFNPWKMVEYIQEGGEPKLWILVAIFLLVSLPYPTVENQNYFVEGATWAAAIIVPFWLFREKMPAVKLFVSVLLLMLPFLFWYVIISSVVGFVLGIRYMVVYGIEAGPPEMMASPVYYTTFVIAMFAQIVFMYYFLNKIKE